MLKPLAVAAALLLAFSCSATGAIPVSPSTVFFKGDVEERTLDGVKNDLGAASGTDLTLVITSMGGSVFDGWMFIQDIERMKAAKGIKIHCVGDIIVASMAANIFESDICDDRAITDRTIILFHPVQAPASPLKAAIDHALAVMIAPRLALSVAELEAKLAAGDWVMTADQAVAQHAADSVVTAQQQK